MLHLIFMLEQSVQKDSNYPPLFFFFFFFFKVGTVVKRSSLCGYRMKVSLIVSNFVFHIVPELKPHSCVAGWQGEGDNAATVEGTRWANTMAATLTLHSNAWLTKQKLYVQTSKCIHTGLLLAILCLMQNWFKNKRTVFFKLKQTMRDSIYDTLKLGQSFFSSCRGLYRGACMHFLAVKKIITSS